MFARQFIDSLDFVRDGRELRGEIPVAELSRLQDMLASPDGKIGFVLRGLQDKEGRAVLELTLDGMCQLRCQRCLQGLAYPLTTVSRLALLPEAELNTSSLDEDDVDYIQSDTHMDVQALIEEEILLGLPFAPKHEVGACQAAVKNLQRPESSPFAVLGKLKDK